MSNYSKAMEIIKSRKQDAEALSQYYLDLAYKNPNFELADRAYRECVFALGKAKFQNSDTSQITIDIDKAEALKLKALKESGIEAKLLLPQYHCRQCNDTGYLGKNMCGCLRDIFNSISTRNILVDPALTFDNAKHVDTHNEKVFVKCEKLSKMKYFNVLACGLVGTGKTFLAQCITNNNSDKSTLFTTSYLFNCDMLNCHVNGDDDAINSYINCDLLVIDDLGTEPMYRNVTMEYLFNVINQRTIYKKSTVVTTNLTLPELIARYGERTVSRLTDKSIGLIVNLVGKDRRHNS